MHVFCWDKQVEGYLSLKLGSFLLHFLGYVFFLPGESKKIKDKMIEET